jgi:hypothetical protein
MARREAPAGGAGGSLHSRGEIQGTPGVRRARRYGWYADSVFAYPGYSQRASRPPRAVDARRAWRKLLEHYGADSQAALGVLALRTEDQR